MLLVFRTSIVFFSLFILFGAKADDLPTLEQAIKSSTAPIKIKATGKRESIEPKVDGKIHGEARYYHPNGQLYGVIHWNQDKKEGSHKLYRENGSLEQYLEYKDGVPNGLAVWMTEEGQIKEFAEYSKGTTSGSRRCDAKVPFNQVENTAGGIKASILEKCVSSQLAKKTPKILPSFDCDTAKTKSEKAICSDRHLARLDRLMNEKYIALTKEVSASIAKDLKSSQLKWLKEREKCTLIDKVELVNKCVLDSMKTRLSEIQIIYVETKVKKGPEQEAKNSIKEIVGTYKKSFQNGDINGNESVSTDVLTITPSENSSNSIKFSVDLNFFNGHTCSLNGEATYTTDKEFVFLDSDSTSNCRMSFRRNKNSIVLDDGNNTCSTYCGVRGHFGKTEFPILSTDKIKFPDIVFQSAFGFRGFGRLSYSASKNGYELIDGRINAFVIDGKTVRQMRSNERGGSMANPDSIVILNDKIFGTTPYSQILEFDSRSGQPNGSYVFDSVQFSGGHQPGLFASKESLLVLREPDLFSIGSDLKLIKKIKVDQKPKHISLGFDFIQKGSRLYSIAVDNPNTYTDCAGGCNFPQVIRQTVVDFTDPKNIDVSSIEEKYPGEPNFHMGSNLAILNDGWILPQIDFKTRKHVLEYHPFKSLAKATSKIDLPADTEIVAMTRVEPIYFISKTAQKYQLTTLKFKENNLTLKSFDLDWLKGSSPSFNLKVLGNHLVVTADYQLAVYDISGSEPNRILQQNFTGPNGSGLIHFGKLELGHLEATPGKPDKTRVSTIVSKEYWDNTDQMALASDIENLKSEDKWAIPLFVEVVKKKTSWHNGGMTYSLMALTKFGPDAIEALPYLLKENLGSSYSEPERSLSFSLIKKIDPTAEKTIQLIKANLDDAFKVGSTVELLEFIGSPEAIELAKATKARWKLR